MPTLDWLNRAGAFSIAARVPYRLLEQASVHAATVRPTLFPVRPEPVEGSGAAPSSARTQDHSGRSAIHDNLLIQGDNLEALKALLPFYRGQVKCSFIDPPYNTRSAFEHYDDNLEHAQWLSMMLPRLQLLRELLREDGSIWVTIDDNEGHYLKVLMDEVFGRGNFVANIFWQKTHTRENRTDVSAVHDHVLLFAKKRDGWKEIRNVLPSSDAQLERFTNPDNDPRGVWASLPAHAKAEKGRREAQFFTITTPSGRKVDAPPGRCWLYTEPRLKEMVDDGRIWFGEAGGNAPRVKKFLTEVQAGLVPSTLWLHQEVGSNGRAKSELVELFPGETPFSTPKPEALLQRILHIATNPGDLVLDSFLGSGTTAAVAHKMGRRWIGIEMGEHAATHCLPRLQKVIDGEQGGISQAVHWQGGGGFRFMKLGAPVFDERGHIHRDVRFATLAAFVWQQETGSAWPGYGPASQTAAAKPGTPYLGTYDKTADSAQDVLTNSARTAVAYYLLFNGILKDKRPASGNVLTRQVLAALLALHAKVAPADMPLVVYGESVRIGPARLATASVTFKQIPYDVRAR